MNEKISVETLIHLVEEKVGKGIQVYGIISCSNQEFMLGRGIEIIGEYSFLKNVATENFYYDTKEEAEDSLGDCVDYFAGKISLFELGCSKKSSNFATITIGNIKKRNSELIQ